MSNVRVGRVMLFFLLLVMIHYDGEGQRLQVETKDIESLIREWNYANNSRSLESFRNVYGAQLIFYTQTVTESNAIALKQELFRLKPYFRQKITTGLTYTPFTSGVIKVDFTKEVMERSGWKQYPSYLLVSFDDNRYQIVGESDYATDKTLKFLLDIGEPMDFEKPLRDERQTPQDSLVGAAPQATVTGLESLVESFKAGDWAAVLAHITDAGMITVPKGYVFMLVGMLVVGGLMIFIADTVQRPRKKKKKIYGVSLERADEADHVIRDFKMQSVFEAFVITLFDPLYFRHRRPKAERVLAGKVSEGETVPDLEFEFHQKDVRMRFAIKCVYYKKTGPSELQLFSPERQQAFRTFEEERRMDLYYILGIGGTPDDPKELYLVPAKAVESEFISKAALKPYWKSGMFYHNRATQKLQ